MSDMARPAAEHLVHDASATSRPPPAPSPPQPVRPFRYPAWLLIAGLLVLAASGYSASLLPPYLRAHRLQQQAEAARDRHADAEAVALYRTLLDERPGLRSARLELAFLLLRAGGAANQQLALDQLAGLQLKSYEWDRLKPVMPEQLQSRFVVTRAPRR